MISQKWLPFIFLILSKIATAQNYGCFGNNNYTTNSTYSTNLITLLSSISSNINNTGFYSSTLGRNPDRVYATALCRTDIQLDSCRTCIQNATTELLTLCVNRTEGSLWRDVCTLRYSDTSMTGVLFDNYIIMRHDPSNVSSPAQFNQNLGTLLDNLRNEAALGGPLIKIGAGNRSAPGFQTIFALLQCMPDMSFDDCTSCLMNVAQRIPGCCANSVTVIILVPSCTLRYQLDPFYNLTRIQEVQAMVSAPSPAPEAVPPPSPPPPPPSPPGKGDDNTTRTIIIVVVSVTVSVVLVAAACLGFCLRKRSKKKPQEIIGNNDEEISTVESLLYDFGKIRDATDDFSESNKLGEGGFGAVYKGKLQNGQEIAVKRLSRNSRQGDLEFKNEVLLMAKLQHRNLVRLLGFSIQGTERLLVYEFVQNASLDKFIFDPTKHLLINWDVRYKIIKGIARGILYLHEDSRFRIIHHDLKASNILLDGNMNPKIADFGMARLFAQDESGGNTSRIVGTYGYMAPEYARHGQFSLKLDVFSFGVIVLEIVSGQKNNSFRNGENTEHMLSFAWRNWHEGTAENLIDPFLTCTSGSIRDMLRCIHIGLLCIQNNAVDRPTMTSVVVMLDSFSITLPVPSQPAFFMYTNFDDATSREMDLSNSLVSKSIHDSSKNDASISELYPR